MQHPNSSSSKVENYLGRITVDKFFIANATLQSWHGVTSATVTDSAYMLTMHLHQRFLNRLYVLLKFFQI